MWPPVLCSDGGGNKELVTDGETGFIVRPGDADQLAEMLRRLRNNQAQGARMGARGRMAIEEHFAVPKMVGNMIAVYEEVMAAAE